MVLAEGSYIIMEPVVRLGFTSRRLILSGVRSDLMVMAGVGGEREVVVVVRGSRMSRSLKTVGMVVVVVVER